MTYRPDFGEFTQIEEDLLESKLDAIRAVLKHSGEKGRSLEGEAVVWLRSFLPPEYGLSTGFIAYHGPDGALLSPQLDIIIYDAMRGGPIVRLTACDVFPIEAVYGSIEVKASLRSAGDDVRELPGNSIESCVQRNKMFRAMTERRFWMPIDGTPIGAARKCMEYPIPRSYVLAFSAEGTIASNPQMFAQRLSNYLAKTGKDAHLHGVWIAGSAFYVTEPIDPSKAKEEDWHHVKFATKDQLAAFKWQLLHDLARFPRPEKNWAPAINEYNVKTVWTKCRPDKVITDSKGSKSNEDVTIA